MSALQLWSAVILGGCAAFAFSMLRRAQEGPPDGEQKASLSVWLCAAFCLFCYWLMLGVLTNIPYTAKFTAERLAQLLVGIVVAQAVFYAAVFLLLPLLRLTVSPRGITDVFLLSLLPFIPAAAWLCCPGMPGFIVYISPSALKIFLFVWAADCVFSILLLILRHAAFRRRVLRGVSPISDAETLRLWGKEAEREKLRRSVALLRAPAAASPMALGAFFTKKLALLPEREYVPEELRLIFRHEICHLRRRDTETKICLAAADSLFWFNPLAWLALKSASSGLERACDEESLRSSDSGERMRYTKLLLSAAGDAGGFSSCLSASAKTLRRRLRDAVSPSERFYGPAAVGVVLGLLVLFSGVVSVSSERGNGGDLLFPADGTELSVSWICVGDRSIRNFQQEDSNDRRVPEWDEAGVMEYLRAMPLTLVACGGDGPGAEGRYAELLLISGDGATRTWIELNGNAVTVAQTWEAASGLRVYRADSGIDWERFAALMK